ncbi:PREDICTED: uncharacterized protein LOC105557416 isoform X2 [Vollenhovia emeryi]|uniref:uncharacterized protein LOC105557416 isoform X2 n=1 Tax=Vollenhovia emeryi TaxID=411798 RepID=UPI0005F39936|nr:PREDICTED: uncharacterized protein LOC105557416 isoform X2 [Vollenhovia emeryi]
MQKKLLLKDVIYAVKLSVTLICCWPLKRDATKFQIFCMKLYHYFCIVMTACLAVPMTYAVICSLNDPFNTVQITILTSALYHTMANFIFYKINYHCIQKVTLEMVHFNNVMKPQEEIVIQRYIDKYLLLYGASLTTFYTMTAVTVFIPAVTKQPFPAQAKYPFDVSYQPLKAIIYVQQSVVGFFVSGQLCINIYMALLIWFTAARFDILIEELKTATNVYALCKCIKTHQELLKYAAEVSIAARPFAFISICCSTVTSITIFLVLMTKPPLPVLLHLCGLFTTGIVEVFMYTWPAEILMRTNFEVGELAFNLLESHASKIWRRLQFIIMRCQKPYLSTILSYFTTLRVMMDDE